jgi:hypothetical protein
MMTSWKFGAGNETTLIWLDRIAAVRTGYRPLLPGLMFPLTL